MPSKTIVMCDREGETGKWVATTLDQIGRLEEFLEEALARSPELLLLENYRTGIRGPYAVRRQLCFSTPQGRGIYPDIVLLAASGHVIVVEVKRCVNPELRDRQVIAQIIDYAASFSAMSEEDVTQLFSEQDSWAECVQELFPSVADPDELAEALLSRIQSGNLNLVIACDKAPPGMVEMVKGIASQSALGFDLDLVELTPYVRDSGGDGTIIFVPECRLSTETVARTVVTVTYREGDPEHSVKVETTPLAEIEENIKAAHGKSQKSWDREAFDGALESMEPSCLADRMGELLELAEGNKELFPRVEFGAGQVPGLVLLDNARKGIFRLHPSTSFWLDWPQNTTDEDTRAEWNNLLGRYPELDWIGGFGCPNGGSSPTMDSRMLEELSPEQFNQLKALLLGYARLRQE